MEYLSILYDFSPIDTVLIILFSQTPHVKIYANTTREWFGLVPSGASTTTTTVRDRGVSHVYRGRYVQVVDGCQDSTGCMYRSATSHSGLWIRLASCPAPGSTHRPLDARPYPLPKPCVRACPCQMLASFVRSCCVYIQALQYCTK